MARGLPEKDMMAWFKANQWSSGGETTTWRNWSGRRGLHKIHGISKEDENNTIKMHQMDQFQESGRRGFCLFAFDTMNSDQTRPPARLCFDYLEVDLKTSDFGRGIHRFFYQREWRRGYWKERTTRVITFRSHADSRRSRDCTWRAGRGIYRRKSICLDGNRTGRKRREKQPIKKINEEAGKAVNLTRPGVVVQRRRWNRNSKNHMSFLSYYLIYTVVDI